MVNFDEIVNRKETNSMKWDKLKEKYGKDDLLAMWIADMDFPVANSIYESILKRAKHPIYGYEYISDDTYRAIIRWQKHMHDFDVKKEWISFTPGVVVAICFAIQALTEVGDEILVPSPVYPPFYNSVTDNDRVLLKCPLTKENTFDFTDMETKISSKSKAIILCNPHNPNGRVWTKEELQNLNDFCKKHDLIVIDDEIHNDIVFNNAHTAYPNISEDALNRTVYCSAPSKTFNTAGLKTSVIIIKNQELKKKFDFMLKKNHIGINMFSNSLLISAYTESDNYYKEMLTYIESNMDYMVENINKIKNLNVNKPESTYLLWVDFRKTELTPDEIKLILINKCGLAFNDGRDYGENGSGFFRINVACSKANLKKAIQQLQYFNEL